ncbi:MAG: NADH-quinone oxidoreductase subunit NuoE [Sedimentisphaerales bacterium]|nr:NADH-quinone oxidoreductase subunit NuoE [Sedimentisphaerales bacterium]
MSEITQEKKDELKAFIAECSQKQYPDSYLIAVLHKVQGMFGYLPREVMDQVADMMQIPTAHIWGVATFYHYFNLKPIGKHTISVCLGTACYVKGAAEILDAIKRELGIQVGQTTEDMLFTLQEARCLGACGIAPVIMIDDKIYGELDAKKVIALINQYRKGVQVA